MKYIAITMLLISSMPAAGNADILPLTPQATTQSTAPAPSVDWTTLPNPSVSLPGLMYTQEMMDNAIKLGEDGAKHGKSLDELFNHYRKNPS